MLLMDTIPVVVIFSFRVPTCILYCFLLIFFCILQGFSCGMHFLHNIYLDNYIKCIFSLYVCIGKRLSIFIFVRLNETFKSKT